MNRLTFLLVVLAACGDNSVRPDAGSSSDASPPDAHVPVPRAVAVAGDYGSPGTGVVSRLQIGALDMRQNVAAGAALGDPVLRYYDGKLYIVNRFGSNNVTILDAATFALVDQISTGTNSNPQDVAVVGDKLYVPALGTGGVLVIKDGSTTTVDLSALDPADGGPDCMTAYAIGTKVYVACGILDENFSPRGVGKIAVIDTATDMMVASANMNYKNPSGFFVRAPESSTYTGDLLIASVPDFTNYTTGCLERVSTGMNLTVGCGVTNQEMAGFANKLAVSADDKTLYIAVGTYDASFNATGTLRSFDLTTGTLAASPLSPDTEVIVDVAACPLGDVVVSDKKLAAGGMRVWRGTAERTTEALPIGLPPTTNALVCYDAP